MRLLLYILTLLPIVIHGAQVKISDLPLATSPSTNTFIEIADMNAATKSSKYLLTNKLDNSRAAVTNALATPGDSSLLLLGNGNWGIASFSNITNALAAPNDTAVFLNGKGLWAAAGGDTIWTNLPPVMDSEGGAIDSFENLNAIDPTLVRFAINYLTNLFGEPTLCVSLGEASADPAQLAISNVSMHNYGYRAGASLDATNVYQGMNYGPYAGASATQTNIESVLNFGNHAGSSAHLSGLGNIYNFGSYAGYSLNSDNSKQIYAFGFNALASAKITNSESIYAYGGLQSSVLNDTKDLVTIGQTAGNSISGAYTNVVLIGDGATIGATGKDQVILGPGMSLTVPKAYQQYQGSLTHAGTVTLDFDAATTLNQVSLTGNVTFATSNLATNRVYRLMVVNAQATNCTPTWPADWRFLGGRPSTLTAGKLGMLSLESWGTADTNVVASYAEEM